MLHSLQALLQLAQSTELPVETTGFGSQLARTALSLLAVCAASWWVLRYAAKRGLLARPTQSKHLTILDRIALDARRSVVVVKVGSKALVLGVSDEGIRTLSEIDPATLNTSQDSSDVAEQSPDKSQAKLSFKALLQGENKD